MTNNSWEMSEDDGLDLDSYYWSDDYDDDYFDEEDQSDYDEFDDYDRMYGPEGDEEGLEWEDLPLLYRLRYDLLYWYRVYVVNPWRGFPIRHRLDRCPGCRKIYRFSGDHTNCPIPF